MLWIEICSWSISRWIIRMSTKLRARFQWPVFGTIPQLMGFRTCRAGWELQNLSWKEALTAHGRPSKWRSDWQNTSKQFGYTTKVGCKIVSWEPFCTVSCSMSFCLSFSFSFFFSFSFSFSLSFFFLSLSLSLSFRSLSASPPKAYPPLRMFGVWISNDLHPARLMKPKKGWPRSPRDWDAPVWYSSPCCTHTISWKINFPDLSLGTFAGYCAE